MQEQQKNPHSRSTRLKRRRIKRIILFASLIVIILLLLTAAILLALEISSVAKQLDDVRSELPPANDQINDTPSDTEPPVNTGYTAFMYDSAKAGSGPLVLVNKTHKYNFPPITLSNMRNSRQKTSDDVYAYTVDYTRELEAEALAAFNSMMSALYNSTKCSDALVHAAYRSEQDQNDLGLDTKGGYSDHNTGYLVTIKFYADNVMYTPSDNRFSEEYKWLSENAAAFGFIVRYPEEKMAVTGVSNYTYAYRYVGKAHAAYITQNGICLEEYIEQLKSYKSDGAHLSVTDADGFRYEIYRTEASSDAQTSIQVPEGKDFTISGDNCGGFIVTVKLN